MTQAPTDRRADSRADRRAYVAPHVTTGQLEEPSTHEAVFVVALVFVLAYWGSAWAFCQAVCWGHGVRSCDVKWYGVVRAECR